MRPVALATTLVDAMLHCGGPELGSGSVNGITVATMVVYVALSASTVCPREVPSSPGLDVIHLRRVYDRSGRSSEKRARLLPAQAETCGPRQRWQGGDMACRLSRQRTGQVACKPGGVDATRAVLWVALAPSLRAEAERPHGAVALVACAKVRPRTEWPPRRLRWPVPRCARVAERPHGEAALRNFSASLQGVGHGSPRPRFDFRSRALAALAADDAPPSSTMVPRGGWRKVPPRSV